MKILHAAESDYDGKGDEERREMRGNSEKMATVAVWVPFAEKLYLAARKEYFLENMRRLLEAALHRFVHCGSPGESPYEGLKQRGA